MRAESKFRSSTRVADARSAGIGDRGRRHFRRPLKQRERAITRALLINVAAKALTLARLNLSLPVFSGEANANDIHCLIREFGEDRCLSAVTEGPVAGSFRTAPPSSEGDPAHRAQMILIARKVSHRAVAQDQFSSIHRRLPSLRRSVGLEPGPSFLGVRPTSPRRFAALCSATSQARASGSYAIGAVMRISYRRQHEFRGRGETTVRRGLFERVGIFVWKLDLHGLHGPSPGLQPNGFDHPEQRRPSRAP